MSPYHGSPVHSKILLYWVLFLYNLAPVCCVLLTSNTSAMLWENVDSVSLNCSATGSTWKMNGQPLPQDPRYYITQNEPLPYSTLIISPVSRKDNGNFTCTVPNKLNNETSNAVTLSLAWNPRGSTTCTAESVGQKIQLGCSWKEGWPAANLTMKYYAGNQTGKNDVFTYVSLVNITQGSNLTCTGDQLGKTTTCTVTLGLPQSTGYDSKSVTIVEEGNTAVMTLNLISSSLPTVFTWYYLNPDPVLVSITSKTIVRSINSSSSLRIYDVALGNAGKYECKASNIFGSQSFNFTLNVTEQGLTSGLRSTNRIAVILSEVVGSMVLLGAIGFYFVKRKKESSKNYGDSLASICDKTIAAEREARLGTQSAGLSDEQFKQKDNNVYGTLAPGPSS